MLETEMLLPLLAYAMLGGREMALGEWNHLMSERSPFTLKVTALSVMKPTESGTRPSLIIDIALRIAGG